MEMMWVCLLIGLLAKAEAETVYTVHYLRSYREDVVENNFGCSQSILYGTYEFPSGTVDALYVLTNSFLQFNAQCQRTNTFIKLFGLSQDYNLLVATPDEVAASIAAIFGSAPTRKIVLSWNYLPAAEERGAARSSLQKLGNILYEMGYEVYLKAPASLLCLEVEGQRYLLDLSFSRFIIELYGQQQGKYITFDSVFASSTDQSEDPGYSTPCPRFPNLPDLSTLYPAKQFYAEKTVDETAYGYVDPTIWEQWLGKAGKLGELNFMDGFGLQSVDL